MRKTIRVSAYSYPLNDDTDDELESLAMSAWLHETYFDGENKPHFSEEHIALLASLLEDMMKYHPSQRPTIAEIRKHPWFDLRFKH